MKTILLIDGDTVAYLAALGSEQYIEWGEGDEMVISNNADVAKATAIFDDQIAYALRVHDATDYKVALTDSVNFRKAILPTYKSKRGKKPMALGAVRLHALANHSATIKPGLEGDDVLGIWSTHPYLIKGFDRKVIVSIDKDMRCIPGLLSTGDGVVKPITEDAANYFHMLQTLTGDQTDGYLGCPMVGPVKATQILNPVTMLVGEDAECMPPNRWRLIVAAYAKKGLTEDDALVQARVARILRYTDYDFKKKEPILWTPPSSSPT